MRALSLLCSVLFTSMLGVKAQTDIGALQSYNDDKRGTARWQQYFPQDDNIVNENGRNRFTRALYGGWTDYRVETSDRPIFAVVKKGHYKSVRFYIEGVPIDSTDYCKSYYRDGMRTYLLGDHRWDHIGNGIVRVHVVALHDVEGAIWQFICDALKGQQLEVQVRLCDIADEKMQRNGDLGVDKPGIFEPSPSGKGLVIGKATRSSNFAHLVMRRDSIYFMHDGDAFKAFNDAVDYNRKLARRIQFSTPDPYINTLGGALVMAADGAWDGKTWLHGCIGWRMPLAGWRAAYMGDVLGWPDRAVSHFDAYAKSQVTNVPATIAAPSQDAAENMARAEKKWGTQMYSNGYICRNPERNDQMHHYDMNLNYMDELLWHFQYDADTAYMRQLWPVIERHLAWEKRNYDPDGDHLYDAYCCIWASDALYYNGGAVTHSSAYNYRGNKLAARIAEIIGKDARPYREEADAILQAMNSRLWLKDKGVWAEYQDAMGLKRLHESPAVWSIYTPIDCGACSPEQAWQATEWVERNIPHIPIGSFNTISTSNWLPYSWSINNVAAAEVMHTAFAFFEAGRSEEGYRLLMGNVMDQMYYGACPGNFGQISYFDAARGECYRDFGDCIGISSRTLLQGLFGIIPQALDGKCIIRPGFPGSWDSVSVQTPYLSYIYKRKDGKDTYEITQNFSRPLQIVVRQNLGGGKWRDVEGSSEKTQLLTCTSPQLEKYTSNISSPRVEEKPLGLSDPGQHKNCKPVAIDSYYNAKVDDIFKNEYLSPRPQTTTLQIPTQGIGEWCHPTLTADINDSVFRSFIERDCINVAGILFRSPKQGSNIVYTSLWDNYPDSVVIPLKGKASSAYLLMAGSTNHMQSRIDNGLVVVAYNDGTTDTLALRNPDNWCPIEQDYYVDGKAFQTVEPRPLRVCLGQAGSDGQLLVSRDLGRELGIREVYGRPIPGGAAQLLCMPLNTKKKLRSLTLRTLSNDVVIGLMGVTLTY